MNLLQKLKKNVDNAGHLVPVGGGNLVPAGIISVDTSNGTVKYLHGTGLWHITEAKKLGLPIDSIVANEQNYFVQPIHLFSDFVVPFGDVSRWR